MTYDCEIEQTALEFQEIELKFKRLVQYYENQCRQLIQIVKKSNDISECQKEFERLFDIESLFAKLKYKYDCRLNKFFDEFIYYFDRYSAREEERINIFYDIKHSSKFQKIFM